MSELSAAEATHTGPGLRLGNGTWMWCRPDSPVETFFLKKASWAAEEHDGCKTIHAGNPQYSGDVLLDPWWFVRKGREMGRSVRLKGVVPMFPVDNYRDYLSWTQVFCLDHVAAEDAVEAAALRQLSYQRMEWEVRFTAKPNIRRNVKGYHGMDGWTVDPWDSRAEEILSRNMLVIRLRMYWVLRGIAALERMLFRVRRRLVKRKLFIQATYWGHPECAFSLFSGTINTPVKQRIHAYI